MVIYDEEMFVPGCFGLLNLNGGDFYTEETWEWIEQGYDGEVALGPEGHLWISGGPGFRSAIQHALTSGSPLTA